MTHTPAAERLAHLKRMHEEWTVKRQTLDGTDPNLVNALTQALADLEELIRDVEQHSGDRFEP